MIPALVKQLGSAFNKTAGTALAHTFTGTVATGNLIVARVLFDNAATASKPIVSSITKQAGETANWVLLGAARSTSTSAGAFASGEMWAIRTTVNWAAASYTVTLDTSVTMKAVSYVEYSGVTATLRNTVGTAYSTTTTAASATTTGTTPQSNDLVLGFMFGSNVAAAGSFVDTDTTGGAWVGDITFGSTGSGAATNNFGAGAYKVLTSGSQQTYNTTNTLTAGNGAIVVILQFVLDPAITQATYRWYDEGTEAGAVALAAQDTPATGDVTVNDGIGQLRVRLQSTNAVAVPTTDDWQLQWEKNASGSWNNVMLTSAEVLAVTYPQANASGIRSLANQSTSLAGMSFLGNGQRLTRAGFMMKKFGSPPATIGAALYAHTGTYGSGTPTGSPLTTASTTIVATTLATTATWYYFTFDASVTLADGTPYFLLLSGAATGDLSNRVEIESDTTTPTYAGNSASNATGPFTVGTDDLIFEIYTANVGTTVLPYASPNLTDGAATTNRLGAGTGSFIAGKVSETGLVTDLGWTASNYTELLYSLDIKNTDVVNGDTLRFRVLRNGTEPLDNVAADSYSESSVNADREVGFSAHEVGQSFAGNGWPLTQASFWVKRVGAPTGVAVARLYAHTGTFGTSSGLPTGAPLATSTTSLDVSAFSTSYALANFDFDGTFVLQAGTNYVIMVHYATAIDANNALHVGIRETTGAHPGTGATRSFSGTLTPSVANDTAFYVRTRPPNTVTPTINIVKITVPPNTGSAVVTHSWATDGSGKTGPGQGTAVVAHTWTTSASGAKPLVPNQGSANTTWTVASVAVGKRTAQGTSTLGYTETLTAAGKKTQSGTATTGHTWALTAAGVAPTIVPKSGSAVVAWTETITAAGRKLQQGSAVTTYTETPVAVGKKVPKGSTVTTWDEALSAVGKRAPKGSTTLNYTEAVTPAVGRRAPLGAAVVAWAETAIATGTKTPQALAATTHTWGLAATGVRPVVGVKQGLAAIAYTESVVASGRRVSKSAATTTYVEAAVAVGKRVAQGSATTSYSFSTANAVGKRTPKGNVATTYVEALAGAGKRSPQATAVTGHVWATTASGVRPIVGVKQGTALIPTTWAPSAVGKRVAKGANTVAHVWTTVAAGRTLQSGAAVTAYVEALVAVGKRIPKATATVTATRTLSAVGRRAPQASAALSATWSTTAAGVAPLVGVKQGFAVVAHTWTPTGAGKKVPKGSRVIPVTWTTTATGTKPLRGAATITHRWPTTAAGRKEQRSAVVIAHIWTTDAVGMRVPRAAAVVVVEFTLTANGAAAVFAAVEGQWNGMSFDAMQYGDQEVADWLLVPV